MDRPLTNRVIPITRGISEITDLARSILNEAINNAKKEKSTKVQETRLELLQNKQSHLLNKLDNLVKSPVMEVTYMNENHIKVKELFTANVIEIKSYLEFYNYTLLTITNIRTNQVEYQK